MVYKVCGFDMSVEANTALRNMFYKSRTLFVVEPYSQHHQQKVIEVNVNSLNAGMQTSKYNLRLIEGGNRLAKYARTRSGDESWTLFIAEVNQQLVGYSFLHAPISIEWNDSLPTMPGTARVSSLFVLPAYRSYGIGKKLLSEMHAYGLAKGLEVWAVVENANKASMGLFESNGKKAGNNYLVKVFKRNVASVTTSPFRVDLLVGHKRARR